MKKEQSKKAMDPADIAEPAKQSDEVLADQNKNESNKEEAILSAPAKVNLFLAITGTDNGYHLLDMLNFPVNMHDTLHILPSSNDQDRILFIDAKTREIIEIPENNTVTKTLSALRKRGLKGHYQILVEKEIPMQAGLGGGSSDGAALLNYLNDNEKLHLSESELIEAALEIGADVPYLLNPIPARIAGRGELVKRKLEPAKIKALLVHPGFGISTPDAFALYDRFNKDLSRAEHLEKERAIRMAIEAWNGKDTNLFYSLLENDLEPAAFCLKPELFEIKNRLQAMIHQLDMHGKVIMSGSGSSLLVLAGQEAIDALYQDLKENDNYPILRKVVIG